jgi:hypothetical protein
VQVECCCGVLLCVHVACCVLRVACCVLRVACCVLRVACCVACCVLRVACCVLRVACCGLRVACCVLRVACCVLRVACIGACNRHRSSICDINVHTVFKLYRAWKRSKSLSPALSWRPMMIFPHEDSFHLATMSSLARACLMARLEAPREKLSRT